jgi:hypothetical protein
MVSNYYNGKLENEDKLNENRRIKTNPKFENKSDR